MGHEDTSGGFRHRQVELSGGSLHLAEKGDARGRTVLFLHGYPQDWHAFEQVMAAAPSSTHVAAVDLPGVGGSVAGTPATALGAIAGSIHELIETEGWADVTLAGHDVGGMVAFSYLTQYPGRLKAAVIMNTVIPGVPPWEKVLANPYIWHFAFHNVPGLPEKLVQGHQLDYFGFFFDALSHKKEKITPAMRRQYAKAYASPPALAAGFGWYRGFEETARRNAAFAASTHAIETPVLYLRGEKEPGEMREYAAGLEAAGIRTLETGVIQGSGHYAPSENPRAVWAAIEVFGRR